MKLGTASADASPETSSAAGGAPTRAGRVRQATTQEPSRPTFRSQNGRLLAACLFLLAIVITLSGCAGGGTEIENLLSSGPTAFDSEAHSAKIVAVSSLPIVCVVAYGTTTDDGLTSTDTDMEGGGGGHAEHHLALLGLEPDTEYHFRFSGIGPRGEGYRSKEYTFRTPPG